MRRIGTMTSGNSNSFLTYKYKKQWDPELILHSVYSWLKSSNSELVAIWFLVWLWIKQGSPVNLIYCHCLRLIIRSGFDRLFLLVAWIACCCLEVYQLYIRMVLPEGQQAAARNLENLTIYRGQTLQYHNIYIMYIASRLDIGLISLGIARFFILALFADIPWS